MRVLLAAFAVPLWCCPVAGQTTAPQGPQPLPEGGRKLNADKIVTVVGSSVSVRRYGVHRLPKWTGGHNRVPPQCTNGQNVFFRVFEMLNDHENMCWRRLPDADWKKSGEKKDSRGRVTSDWKSFTKLPYKDASPRIVFKATMPDVWAEITVPAGYEKLDLVYTSAPNGGKIKVSVDGEAPPKSMGPAMVDTRQDRTVPAKDKLGEAFTVLDSHGKPRVIRPPRSGISHIVELRQRYALDPKKAHTFRVERAGREPDKIILVWGVVYWRGNCVQVVQRAKGGINCGDLPNYWAIQETMALKPDYILMEAINIRSTPDGVTKSLDPGFAWSAAHGNQFKTLVYSACQASSKEFRKWFRVPAHKPPYGAKDYEKTCADEHCEACQQAVADLCKKYDFPLVDVGKTVDDYVAKHSTVRFVPHILNDWYHPNQWGAMLFGQTIHEGIRTHWPELPVRPITMTPPPAARKGRKK